MYILRILITKSQQNRVKLTIKILHMKVQAISPSRVAIAEVLPAILVIVHS